MSALERGRDEKGQRRAAMGQRRGLHMKSRAGHAQHGPHWSLPATAVDYWQDDSCGVAGVRSGRARTTMPSPQTARDTPGDELDQRQRYQLQSRRGDHYPHRLGVACASPAARPINRGRGGDPPGGDNIRCNPSPRQRNGLENGRRVVEPQLPIMATPAGSAPRWRSYSIRVCHPF